MMGIKFEDQYPQAKKPKYDCVLFDDTLYPLASGLAAHCRKNIEDYMVEKIDIEESKVSKMAILLCKNYGTTMAGLRAIGYTFNYDDYHRFFTPLPNRKYSLSVNFVVTSLRVNGADHALESLHNMTEASPELWEEGDEARGARHDGKIAIEMPVTA